MKDKKKRLTPKQLLLTRLQYQGFYSDSQADLEKLADYVLREKEATKQIALAELLEKAPKDRKDDCCIDDDCPRHTWNEGLNTANAQWREALDKIRGEV